MAIKRITFGADADKLELARLIAESKGTTLEAEVRQWLEDFASGKWKLPSATTTAVRQRNRAGDWFQQNSWQNPSNGIVLIGYPSIGAHPPCVEAGNMSESVC